MNINEGRDIHAKYIDRPYVCRWETKHCHSQLHFVSALHLRDTMHSLREMVLGTTRRSTAGPSSPSFSDITNASAMNFGLFGPKKVITRSNLKSNIQALEDVRLGVMRF